MIKHSIPQWTLDVNIAFYLFFHTIDICHVHTQSNESILTDSKIKIYSKTHMKHT